MTSSRRSTLAAVLALALAGAAAAWADRDDGGRADRHEQPRGNGERWRDTSLRPREEWRGRGDFERGYPPGSRRVDDDRGHHRSNDALYQRLHDNNRGDSGYYRRGGQRPVNDVIREVQDRYGGQVIGVQNSEGGSMYRVRVLQRDGRVKNVMVPSE